jgi:cytochrome c oxidase assembly factor CtaG
MTWTLDPVAIVIALVAFAMLAMRRVARPWLFAASVASVMVALVSPLAFLAHGVFFSAHMAQHLLLVLVAPPLLLASLAHEAPGDVHEGFSVRTIFSWALGVSAMWLWHAPTLCNAASQSSLAFHAQTISLLAMGGAFFWPIFGQRAAHRLPVFGALAYLFTACAACTVLGIGITFSPVEVCSVFARPSAIREAWNVSTKADQEVGGLLMWVPGCLVYAGCIVFMYGRYARAEGVTKERSREA